MSKRDKTLMVTAGITGIGLATWRTMFPWLGDDIKTLRAIGKLSKGIKDNMNKKRFVIDMFEEQVARYPRKTFIIFEDKAYSYEYVEEMANRVANVAMTWKLPLCDTVAMMIENEPAFVWTFLGLQKAGIASAFINFHLKAHPLLHSIKTSDAKVFIVGAGEGLLNSVEEIRDQIPPELPVYVQGIAQSQLSDKYISMDELLFRAEPVPIAKSVRENIDVLDPMCYIYTSGTTGLPKAAIQNQARGAATSKMFQMFDFGPNDVAYIVTPMYHSAATTNSLFNTIDQGATVVIRRKFSAHHFWEDVRKHNVTVIQYIGELCRYLLRVPENPLDASHKVRVAYGNGLRWDIWEDFRTRFRIPHLVEFFAATEGTCTFMNVCGKRGAVGRISPLIKLIYRKAGVNVDVIKFDTKTGEPIRDSNGRCISVQAGEEGLIISGITDSHSGFYKGPKDMDEKKILRNVLQDGDQWFNYGDLVYLDKDYYIYFRDRTGDTFRWKGENVSTGEVANAISCLPFVHDVNVYGVTVSGADGRAGMAAISLKNNYTVSEDLLKQIYQQCEHELPSYARPLFLRFMNNLIITQTMKNRKVELVEEGFDPHKVKDAMYFIDPASKSYKCLNTATYQKIRSSKL